MDQDGIEPMTSEKAAGLADQYAVVSPHEVIASRVRELRKKHGWSAERLAAEMDRVGIPWTRIVVAKLETGRRETVTVQELLALSYVLDIGVLNLLVPTEDEQGGKPLAYWAVPRHGPLVPSVRAWIRGEAPLPGQDPRFFFSEIPLSDHVPPAMTPAEVRAESARIRYHREHRGEAPALEVIKAADAAARAALTEDNADG